MNLYKITVVTPLENINRGVWADEVTVVDGVYYFKDNNEVQKDFLVASYPTQCTFITSIETKEEYDTRKAK